MWYGPDELEMDWPDGWEVGVRAMADAPSLGPDEMAAGMARPIGSAPLEQLAAGRRNCCILVDDLTRPTPAAAILPHVLPRLEEAGLAQADVFFIMANGAHGARRRAGLVKKLGAGTLARFVVMRHDAHQNLVRLGEVEGVGEVLLNRFFHEADLKIGITGVMPHFMCGFSGGAKIVMPGACGLETIARTHEHTVGGLPARVGVVEGNAMRRLIEDCGREAGLDFCVNCVFTSAGEVGAVFCGAPAEAHAAAVQRAREVYATDVVYGCDAAVFNAFPKDTEFIQAMAALNVWADRETEGRAPVRPGGSIVVITACTEGLGAHELIEYGRRHFVRRDRHGAFRRILQGRNLLLLAPHVSPATVAMYYGPRARHFRQWTPLREALGALHPDGARVVVYPTSALQLDSSIVGAGAAGR
jgi:nickel-dependent lactate racemase